jgi:hypothetical protein
MPVRLKKLIGTVLLVALVIAYALVATLFAVARLGDTGPVVQFSFFLVSGLLWVLPAMGIIKWMVREPRPKVTARQP